MMRNAGIALIASLVVSVAPSAAAPAPPATQQLTREIYKQLVEINTTESVGDTYAAAKAMGDRLLAAGYPKADVQVFQSFWIEARNPGGHSSQPRKDNAIYELTDALNKLAKHDFAVQLNDTTRGYFEKMATIEHGQLAADLKSLLSAKPDPAAIARLSAMPPYNAQIRTTCVATRLEGGHADNALPQLARAMVNCRIVPTQSPDQVQKELEDVFADPKLAITAVHRDTGSEPSAMNKDLLAAIEKLTAKFWPGIPTVPTMSAGATDGRFLRNLGIPTYGHSGLASDIFDVRAHGKDERVSVQAMFEGEEYLYELVKELSGG